MDIPENREYGSAEFEQILSRVFWHDTFRHASRDKQIGFLNFLIEVLKKDVQGYYGARLIYKNLNVNIAQLFPAAYMKPVAEHNNFDLTGLCVIPCPDSMRKCMDAIKDIKREGFNIEKNTPQGQYFSELGLVVIHEGKHHVAASLAQGKPCFAYVREYRFTGYFDKIKVISDDLHKKCWAYEKPDGLVTSFRVMDGRCALLYELLRAVSLDDYHYIEQHLQNAGLKFLDGLRPDKPTEEEEVSIRIKKTFSGYKVDSWIYPGRAIRESHLQAEDVYDALSRLEQLGFVEGWYEIYCGKCQKTVGVVRKLGELPKFFECEHCGNVAPAIENSILIYKVKRNIK